MTSITKKIYYHDTDCGGVVYYANYLKYFEEARTEYFEARGVSVKELALAGTLFVVSSQKVDYKHPGQYADILDIQAKITKISKVKIEFNYEIYNQKKELLVIGETTLVAVGNNFKPKAMPEAIKEKLST